ncbi:MAG: DUF1189 family protein, partial [archaeon]
MRVRDYFKTIAKSLNPNSYKKLVEDPLRQGFNYFLFLIILCTIIFFVLFVPHVLNLSNTLGNNLDKFEEFNIDINMKLKDPFYLSTKPEVLLDLNKTNLTGEQILINDREIVYKEYVFFGEKRIVYDELTDIKATEKTLKDILPVLGILILPSIIVWVFVFFSIKFLIYIFIAAFIALLISKGKHRYGKLMKVGLYASTLSIILELALLPVYRISWWITLAIFIIYFWIGAWITMDTELGRKKKKDGKPDFRP